MYTSHLCCRLRSDFRRLSNAVNFKVQSRLQIQRLRGPTVTHRPPLGYYNNIHTSQKNEHQYLLICSSMFKQLFYNDQVKKIEEFIY